MWSQFLNHAGIVRRHIDLVCVESYSGSFFLADTEPILSSPIVLKSSLSKRCPECIDLIFCRRFLRNFNCHEFGA